MRKAVLIFLFSLMMAHCATDVIVTSGTIAEGKKEEAEQAEKNKQDLLDKYEEQQKAEEERVKQMKEQ